MSRHSRGGPRTASSGTDRVTPDADTTKKLLESTLAKTDWFNTA
jgi:hypothetical protein